MRKVFAALVALAIAGCSSSSASSSTGGSSGGSGGGSTGSFNGTLTATGPYAYSGAITADAYAVGGGSNSEVSINLYVGSDVVGFTGLLTGTSNIAVHTYDTSAFGQYGLGITEPHGTDMVTNSTDSVTLNVSSLGDDREGEQFFHATVDIGYHGTQALADGGQVSGAGTIHAEF